MSTIGDSAVGRSPRRRVSIKRDGQDFVVSFQPENVIVFRHDEVDPLRRLCRSLHWEIVSDAILDANERGVSA